MKLSAILSVSLWCSMQPFLLAQHITIKADTISVGCDQATYKFSFTVTPPLSDTTSILWDFGTGISSNDTIPAPTVKFTSNGKYNITLKLNNVYFADTSVLIPKCLDVPNVFTPNGDGRNDQFNILYFGEGIISFRVFSRAGVLLYYIQGKNISWDGYLESGEMIPTGIYYYVIEVQNTSPAITKKGFFYVFY